MLIHLRFGDEMKTSSRKRERDGGIAEFYHDRRQGSLYSVQNGKPLSWYLI